MCTMSFPPEVIGLPQFLMMKIFPLFYIVFGFIGICIGLYLFNKLFPNWPEWSRVILGIGLGLVVAYWIVPLVCQHLLGRSDGNVSLLNTFFALILPRMANGFSIFLLKGFFDSLPRELYEAADLDGANEWTKFWLLTMNLSKPILAIIALGAFTQAYSEFMMALVIIPNPKMWTLMVWIFQLQSVVHPSVVYATLIVAAIPTFLMFVLCQNVIMRGIIVPQEK